MKVLLSYNSLELKTTGLVHLVFQAKRYRDEEAQRRREEENVYVKKKNIDLKKKNVDVKKKTST
ncbi:Hypothetical protein FKW44_018150 [Caligus rogercresseyi]|uniref:Uncharacterized protein n=1 Tax=Caligus rogercresseyi TaxID=217165 RepID=A0A7T8JWK5_CALRO|nr:Hypothetical protein FKW44_018150 [Caligus rogercresseyi]